MMEQSRHLPESESAVPQLTDWTRQAAELGTKFPELNMLHYRVRCHIKYMVYSQEVNMAEQHKFSPFQDA